MQSLATIGRRVAAVSALAFLGACAEQSTSAPVAPVLPSAPAIPSQYRGAAFLMDVSATKRTVKITAPSSSINARLNPNVLAGDANYSLLGGDAIELITSNFQAGAVGAVEPGKVLITFDLQILNKLDGYQLTTPTFPTPPSGVTGVQAFPFEISVTTTSGGVGSNGNEVVITTPRFGVVVPSSDWGNLPIGDGNFHNFFNDVGCTATANDCFRYEPFAAIAPLNTSSAQRVGFIIDPTVGDFRAKIIVAADLAPTVTAAPGTVAGAVTSNIGPVNGATISVSGGFSGNSNASGAYSVSGVASGPNKTVSISNLPAGCSAAQGSFANQTVPAAGTLTVNFAVTCAVPTGTVLGTITKQQDGSNLAGVTVVVTPTSGAALASVTTAANGGYSRSGVPTVPATGSITLSTLPAGCVNAGPYAYSGHTVAGTTLNIVVSCPPAPVTYPVTGTWAVVNTGPTGRQAQLTLAIDMGTAPGSLSIDGANADPLAGISFNFSFNGTQLSNPGANACRALLSIDEFDLAPCGNAGAGTTTAVTSLAVGSQNGLTKTGNFQLVRVNFNIASGVTGALSFSTAVTEALASVNLTNITSSVTLNIAPLIVP